MTKHGHWTKTTAIVGCELACNNIQNCSSVGARTLPFTAEFDPSTPPMAMCATCWSLCVLHYEVLAPATEQCNVPVLYCDPR